MLFQDTIYVIVPHRGPVGTYPKRPSIKDKPIEELIENLTKEGVPVAHGLSREKIEIMGKTQADREGGIVPLGTKYPWDVNIVAYYLRNNKGLELEISDYESITERPPQGDDWGYSRGYLWYCL